MRKKKIIIQNNFSEQIENIDEDYAILGLNKEVNPDIYFKYKNNKVVIVKEASDSSKTDSTDIPSSESLNKNEVLDTDIIDIKSLYGKEIYYYNMLEKFFQSQPDKEIKRMIDIINGSNNVSLRFLDWFVTRYCYLYKLSISINTPYNKENNFNINISYKAQLKSYKKKYFDPFRRKKKFYFIIEKNNNKLVILTTIGQLNFFRWAISNDIINYTENNYKNIIVKFNHVNTYFKKNKLILDEETSNDDSKDSKKNNVPSVVRNIILEL